MQARPGRGVVRMGIQLAMFLLVMVEVEGVDQGIDRPNP